MRTFRSQPSIEQRLNYDINFLAGLIAQYLEAGKLYGITEVFDKPINMVSIDKNKKVREYQLDYSEIGNIQLKLKL